MLIDHFPLKGLRLRTPRLELRLPDPEELSELADLAAEGIHDPASMPFLFPWTDLPPAERALSVVTHHWRALGSWSAQDWNLPLSVFHNGVTVGVQSIYGRNFGLLGEVDTSSWLGIAHHGNGIGTEMRAAVLHLAFTGLGARSATSGSLDGNHASAAVSRKLGYRPDGIEAKVVQGRPRTLRRLRLTRQDWQAHAGINVHIDGLEPCLPLLGVDDMTGPAVG